MKRFFVLMAIGLLLCGCKKEGHYLIPIINESDVDIYAHVTLASDRVPNSFDDHLSDRIANMTLSHRVRIESGTTNTSILDWTYMVDSFEKVFKNSQLRIFFLDADVYETIPWKTIAENNMILECRFWTLDDLIRDDWKVYYPARE